MTSNDCGTNLHKMFHTWKVDAWYGISLQFWP